MARTVSVTETEFQQQVLALARISGWKTLHPHDEPGSLVLVRPPCLIFVGLKSEGGKLRHEQREWLEAIEKEEEELARRRTEALTRIRQAGTRFEELEERRAVLAPLTFSGDEKATAELEAVEDEHDRLVRAVGVARAALPEFERMLEEADKRSSEARADIHRVRYRAHKAEADALTLKMDELAEELCELIEKRNSLFSDASQELRYFDPDEANGMAVRGGSRGRDWLENRFAQWLR